MKRNDMLRRMGLDLPESKQIRVIISSDVANEADDPFSIVHQLLTPSFDIQGVIAAHFEGKAPGQATQEQSYQALLRLLQVLNLEDVPALRGCPGPLPGSMVPPTSEGVEFLIRTALSDDPRPLFVTVLGALTDVAAALLRCPAIAGRFTIVWIGGGPCPDGGREFNLCQDVRAAQHVFASTVGLWQIPAPVYGAQEVTLAELAHRVRPCGAAGIYLFEQLAAYNRTTREPSALRKGETWILGDSPVVAALLGSDWRGSYRLDPAPAILDNLSYAPISTGGKSVSTSPLTSACCWRISTPNWLCVTGNHSNSRNANRFGCGGTARTDQTDLGIGPYKMI